MLSDCAQLRCHTRAQSPLTQVVVNSGRVVKTTRGSGTPNRGKSLRHEPAARPDNIVAVATSAKALASTPSSLTVTGARCSAPTATWRGCASPFGLTPPSSPGCSARAGYFGSALRTLPPWRLLRGRVAHLAQPLRHPPRHFRIARCPRLPGLAQSRGPAAPASGVRRRRRFRGRVRTGDRLRAAATSRLASIGRRFRRSRRRRHGPFSGAWQRRGAAPPLAAVADLRYG